MERDQRIVITKNALIGQAVGDAFGVPVEFLPREAVRSLHLREMAGADSGQKLSSRWDGRIPKGSWSDDTSMTVARDYAGCFEDHEQEGGSRIGPEAL